MAPWPVQFSMFDPMTEAHRTVTGNRSHGSESKVDRPLLGRSNEEWVRLCRGGEGRESNPAFEELASHLRSALGSVFGTSNRVSDDDLDDFAQEALLKVLASIDSFRGDSRFTTWATAIAIRVAYTVVRRRRSAHVTIEEVGESVEQLRRARRDSADVEVERTALVECLRAAVVERLTERQRAVIIAELRGVDSERTAELLGTNRNAVYKVYHDARVKLKRALTEAGHTAEDVRELLDQLT